MTPHYVDYLNRCKKDSSIILPDGLCNCHRYKTLNEYNDDMRQCIDCSKYHHKFCTLWDDDAQSDDDHQTIEADYCQNCLAKRFPQESGWNWDKDKKEYISQFDSWKPNESSKDGIIDDNKPEASYRNILVASLKVKYQNKNNTL